MIRTQIQFTEQQLTELRRLARDRESSVAAVVRDAVDRELARRESLDDAWKRALAAVGSYSGGGGNVAEDHDEYLADAYASD